VKTVVSLSLLILSSALGPTPALAQTTAKKVGAVHQGNAMHPQFSPDGKRIAYEVNTPADKHTELFVIDVAPGSKPQSMVPETMGKASRYGGGKRIKHEFAWSYTGNQAFSYTVGDTTGGQDIYIDNWSDMISTDKSPNGDSSWDPKGPRFVFGSGRTGLGDLYLWDNGNQLQLTFDNLNAELYPSWSADGTKVLFVSAGKSGSHIKSLDVNLFAAVPLVQFDGKDSTRPTFSPDGRSVAFFSNKASTSVQEWGLWVTPSQPGGTPRNIGAKVLLPSKGGASWTPDGKGVIAVMDNPDRGDPICIFPVDGGEPNCLATGTRVNRDPLLRVIDGQWRLVYTAQQKLGDNNSDWQELYTFDVPR
jgi:Tol biopolymer transport system component